MFGKLCRRFFQAMVINSFFWGEITMLFCNPRIKVEEQNGIIRNKETSVTLSVIMDCWMYLSNVENSLGLIDVVDSRILRKIWIDFY